MDDKLPINDYSEYFGPNHQLHIQTSNMENQNTSEYLQGVRSRILEHLSQLQPTSGVSFHDVPTTHVGLESSEMGNTAVEQTELITIAHDAELEHEHAVDTRSARHAGPAVHVEEVTELPRSTGVTSKSTTLDLANAFALPGQSRTNNALPQSSASLGVKHHGTMQ